MRLLLEGPDIESVLTRVHTEHGPDARIISAEKVRAGGLAGFFAKERFEVAVEVTEPAVASGDLDAPASILALAAAVDRAERQAGPPPEWSSPAGNAQVAFADVLARVDSTGQLAQSRPGQMPGAGARGRLAGLRRLGVPEHLLQLADTPGEDVLAMVSRVVGMLPAPPPPPTKAGQVLAVVGDGAAAVAEALRLAGRLRLPPSAVLLAAPTALGTGMPAGRLLTSPTAVSQRGVRLARATTATIVAVDAPMGPHGASWAAQIIAALEPASTWLLAEATRKVVDTADQIARIGGVDALAITDTEATRDPAAMLALRLPVALLDGQSATALAWAALLCGRLTDGDRPC